jgi:hypothetical protein
VAVNQNHQHGLDLPHQLTKPLMSQTSQETKYGWEQYFVEINKEFVKMTQPDTIFAQRFRDINVLSDWQAGRMLVAWVPDTECFFS